MSIPKINKSASLDQKVSHINKNSGTVPMLKMLLSNKILDLNSLDEAGIDELLIANSWLSLDELTRDQIILDKQASKVDAVMRTPKDLTESLSAKGLQASEGMMKINLGFVFMVHRNHETDKLVNRIIDLVRQEADIDLAD